MQLLKGIRLLEKAYENKDWDKVVESYFLISGEKLDSHNSIIQNKKVIPKKKPGRPKKVKVNELISDYKELEPDPSPKPQKQLKKVTRTESADIAEGERRQPRTEPVRFRGNSFVDDGTLALEDKLIDKKLKKGKGGKGWKRAQPRPQHEFVQVDCGTRSCNTIVEVSPELYMADTTYFCPKCLSNKR